MSLSNDAEAALWDAVFLNVDFAGVSRGLVAAGSFYLAFHTSDPGEAGKQNANEATYTGYARTAVPRDGTGFVRTGTAPTQIANVGTVTGPVNGGGSQTLTHFSLGVASSGATVMVGSGALTSPLVLAGGLAPVFTAGQLTATLD